MEQIDLAYIAGFFDGEGNVQIISRQPSIKHNITFYLRVMVVNTDLTILEWLKSQFGGSIHKKKRNENWQACYVWQSTTKQASEFLQQICPYLKLKRKQAELAIKFQSGKGYKGQRRSGAMKEEEKQIRNLIMAMNGRKKKERVVAA